MNIETDRALLPAGKTAVRYLTVTITAPERARRHERPAVHAALVLDRSGSMAGRKIEMAKKAVDHAVRLLNERDRLAVVCYDTEIDTLLGATTATAEAKKLALTRLKAIDARGGTDLCGGWLRGAGELTPVAASAESSQAEADTALRRVLLLSDGQANEGETNPDVLARHAADLRAKGIATSTFGVGADFDEVLMSRLATEGGGHFYFIEQPAQIPDFLTSELGEALEVVARDARLVIAGGPGVEIGCLNEFPVETMQGAAGTDVHVRLGDLVSAQELTVGIAVRCPAGAAGDTRAHHRPSRRSRPRALSAADADRVARGGRIRRCRAACQRRRARRSGDAPRRTRARGGARGQPSRRLQAGVRYPQGRGGRASDARRGHPSDRGARRRARGRAGGLQRRDGANDDEVAALRQRQCPAQSQC